MMTIYDYEKYEDEYSLCDIDGRLYAWEDDFITRKGLFLIMEEVEDCDNYADNFFRYVGMHKVVNTYAYILSDLLCSWEEYFEESHMLMDKKYEKSYTENKKLKVFFISRNDLEEGRYDHYKEA